jgi:hypothetical protein
VNDEEIHDHAAKCANEDCKWFGFSFRPAEGHTGKRICPSCQQPLQKWKPRPEPKPDEEIK